MNMKLKTRLLHNPGLLLFLLASACAPAMTAVTAQPGAIQPIVIQPTIEATSAAVQPITVDPASTDPVVIVVEPVATSRGPNLEATAPSTVSLASGGLQLIEFFRFT
jgi:hypothetical protein